MSVFVLSASYVNDLDGAVKRPEFRKASKGMMFCHAAMEKLLTPDPSIVSTLGANQCGLVVGTSQGELCATKEFLEAIAFKDMARPIVFQNSLHNSTTGYLSLQFGIAGQAMTVSNGFRSGEDALSTAQLLLEQQMCQIAFVFGYDLLVDGLEEARNEFYPLGLTRGEGAGAMMLASATALRKIMNYAPIAVLDQLSFEKGTAPSKADFDNDHYEADGVARFAKELLTTQNSGPLKLAKPNGNSSLIEYTRL